MTTEFLRVEKYLSVKRMEMQPELSLGPTWPAPGFVASAKSTKSSSSESDGSSRKKRKHFTWEEPVSHANLELQLNDPLPLDWEQCLDLQSGRMYYLNRKTLKKSWIRPKEQSVNLELNISTTQATVVPTIDGSTGGATPVVAAEETKKATVVSSGPGGNMVAVPCANCHLLVMLCKSSPSCPNCKFVQPLVPPPPAMLHRKLDAVKPLETLSLLH
uniref:WW domain-containing protein n=1 Tax=Leersia perrieri TaxID=77586 RepID=A0A0D9XXZ5_9ORYZ